MGCVSVLLEDIVLAAKLIGKTSQIIHIKVGPHDFKSLVLSSVCLLVII